jgi:hypothetical protein
VATAYWWNELPGERFWLEIRWIEGLGTELRCPLVDKRGKTNPWYDLVGDVRKGDTIYHWHAKEKRFVGRSRAAAHPEIDGKDRVVALQGFAPLETVVDRPALLARRPDFERARAELTRRWPDKTLYMPFQFRADGLRMMSNYFTKLPRSLVPVLFGADGLAGDSLRLPSSGVPPAAAEGPKARPGFLQPFEAKADADYVAKIAPRTERRSRHHETLVNGFVEWAEARGLRVRRNQAIDIAVGEPPVVVEAKIIPEIGDAGPIRQAVGQLYEYRYFQIVSTKAQLVLLSSRPLPTRWVRYLEQDRGIGVAWPAGGSFQLSKKAAKALRP